MAVFDDDQEDDFEINEDDITYKTCRGSGAGGQNRNKRDTAVIATHGPTGLSFRSENQRSQFQNKQEARRLLIRALRESHEESEVALVDSQRRNQVGAGARADKRRTVALQRDQVTDDKTGKKISATQYLDGHLDKLWS